MRIAFRKVWRDLWHNKGRTLLVVMSIAVGVMALGMTVSGNTLLKRQMTASQIAMNPSHAMIWLDWYIDDETVESLTRLPEVEVVEGLLTTSMRWKTSPGDDWQDGTLRALEDYRDQSFDLIELRAGGWPDRETAAVAFNHIEPFGLPVPGEEIYLEINERERAVPIVGAVRDPMILSPPFEANPIFYVTADFYKKITGNDLYSQLRFVVPEYSRENVEAAGDAIERHLKRQGVTIAYLEILDPEEHFAQSTMDGVGLILTVMAVASLGLSIFLIINIMNALLVQQVPQIGIMKAIGGLTRQIAMIYLSGVIVYGLIGLLIAVPVGAFAGDALSRWMLSILNVDPAPFELLPESLALQVSTGMLTPLLVAIWPVSQGVSISVREALSTYGVGSGIYGSRFFDRILGKIRGLPRMLTLMLRNTFRRPGRVAMTEITLLVAGAIFLMVLSTSQSFTHSVERVFGTFGFDVLVVFEKFQRIDEITPIIESRPNVEKAEMWVFYSGYVRRMDATNGDEYEAYIRGIPDYSEMFTPELTAGRNLHPDDGHAILLNQKLAADMGMGVGDQIILDLGDEGDTTWTIVGLVLDLGSGPDQNTAYMPRDALNIDLNTRGRGIVAEIRSTHHDLATMEAIEKDLREYFEAEGIGVNDVQSILEMEEQANAQFNLITIVLLIMVVLIAIVGGLGLSGTLSINVYERRREIGVMRAVGASSWDVGRIFMGEGLVLGWLSWVQAIPLGIFGGQLFVDALGVILEFPFEYQFSIQSVWLWLGIVSLLSLVSSWVPARRATQISVNESLAYE
jgi:putative ABC transport system permease protein